MTLADSIRRELDAAKQCDEQARQHRRTAGAMLRKAGDRSNINVIVRQLQLDPRTVELLMSLPPP